MCKIAIEACDFVIKVNEKKVYLPKETRVALIKSLNQKKRCKISKSYYEQLLSGKVGFVDCFGGLTISKEIWEKMVEELDLVLINTKKQDRVNFLPSIAAS